MDRVSRAEQLRSKIAVARQNNQSVGFVPTMGYLHAGHRSLIETARRECGFVVVSLFVNPTQFGEGEDLERYPRDIDADSVLCESVGADVLFTPNVEEMYPAHESDALVVSYPELSTKLCGHFRPGHFDGVTTVMTKFLSLVHPDKCYMGKKDGQQLSIIRRLASDVFPDCEVVGCPTVREDDGLALSSRNSYLSDDERSMAAEVNKNLDAIARVLESDFSSLEDALTSARHALEKTGLVVQYCDLVHADTFEPARQLIQGDYLLCAAVVCGTTRLIDNYAITVNSGHVSIDRGITISSLDNAHV